MSSSSYKVKLNLEMIGRALENIGRDMQEADLPLQINLIGLTSQIINGYDRQSCTTEFWVSEYQQFGISKSLGGMNMIPIEEMERMEWIDVDPEDINKEGGDDN